MFCFLEESKSFFVVLGDENSGPKCFLASSSSWDVRCGSTELLMRPPNATYYFLLLQDTTQVLTFS